MKANDFAYSVNLVPEVLVTQESSDTTRRLTWVHIKKNQAVPGVKEGRGIKVLVAREEGWPIERMKQWDHIIVVFHPRMPDVGANMSEVDSE
jgi:hypothetical protein